MGEERTAGQVFDQWAADGRAGRMGDHHWPVVKQAFDLLEPPPRGGYLEIGVGDGYALRAMATGPFAGRKCTGIDVSERMVDIAKRLSDHLPEVGVLRADFTSPDFTLEPTLAMIFSMEVFYYLDDIQAGIDKAFGLLRPSGVLAIMVDYYTENEASHSWPSELGTPMRLWSREDYVAGLERAGFTGVMQRTLRDREDQKRDSSHLGTLLTWGQKPV